MQYLRYGYHHNYIEVESWVYKISTYHYNWHAAVEVLVVLHGRLELCHDGQYTVLSADDCAIMAPRCGHATFALTEDTVAMVLHIPEGILYAYDASLGACDYFVETTEETRYDPLFTALRKTIADLMLVQIDRDDEGPDLRMDQGALQCVGLILDLIRSVKVPKRDATPLACEMEASFKEMIHFIDTHYRTPLSLQEVAKVGGYRDSYASQCFRRQLGMTFTEYVTRMRLREAVIRLVNTDDRMVVVANACGFRDVKAFNVAFKRHFHGTPSAYRVAARQVSRNTLLEDWKDFVSVEDVAVLSWLRKLAQQDCEPGPLGRCDVGREKELREAQALLERATRILEDLDGRP